jgi:DivIVA domain-containing protein
MTPEELRSAELREKFRGHDPDEVEAVLTKWAAAIERGERLSLADLMEQRFRPRFRGYDPGEVKALIERLIVENT